MSLTLAQTFKNDGFTDTRLGSDAVLSDGFMPFLGLGYGIAVGPTRLAAQLYMPVRRAEIAYGTGGSLSVAGVLPAW